MRTRFRLVLAALAASVASSLAIAGVAQAATSPSTPVHLSPAQVAQTLFVAGDVGRLSLIPSGTESVVLEKVLQQLYTNNATLAPSQAASEIQGLQAALTSGSQAISPATLTVMGGNERILAILRALTDSNPAPEVQHALAQVTDQALSVSEQSTQFLGQSFDASADSVDTLSFSAFSPSGILAHSAALAATNPVFGQARDALWKQASNESVFDSTQTLLGENPALQNSAISSLVNMLNADGSLDTTVGALEGLIDGGIQQISGANCTVASGTDGTSPNDCASGALHDAQLVAQNCPNGPTDTSANCQAARNQAESDQPGELATIDDQQAVTAAEANALGGADQTLALANAAEAQAAAQLAGEENAYLNYQSFQQAEKASFDVLSLGVSLSVSEIDPVAAVGALLNVVGDATGFAFSGPDPNMLILEGIQGIAQQLSDFEQYTEGAFQVVDAQLSNLSTQVSQIAAQITNAQQQLTQLATQTGNLQSSVDHLQSEVQSLFAQGARNDLGTLVNQYIGFQQANGTPLPQTQFAQAAGALYQDATSTALTQTLLTVPTGFDSVSADGLIAGIDPLTLDTNINLFNFFGADVTDAPASVGWPGALTTTCPPNANPVQHLCLPDPDFWATSARAFSQLLLENPSYVTPTRIAQLQAIQQEGQLIANALAQLSVDNAGTDAGGTGNKTLDAALNYFRYWGDAGGHPGGTPPSLPQAIKNEEQTYLSMLAVPTSPQMDVTPPVNPWGSPQQLPDTAGVQKLTSLQNTPVCPKFAGLYDDPNIAGKTLPSLPTSLLGGIDPQFQTAARLGLGTISACWYAAYTGTDGNNFGDVVAEIQYYWTDPNDTHVEIAKADASVPEVFDCVGAPNPMEEFTPDVLATVVGGWQTGANSCPDLSGDFTLVNVSAPAAFNSAQTAVEKELSNLRRDVYNDIISGGGGLTAGDTQADNVQQAAIRLDGANELLDGYISLGLPQALASDDTLQGLVSGTNSDTFAPTSGGLAGTAPAPNVPAQIVNLYEAAINDDPTNSVLPVEDPADLIASLVDQRASQLAGSINAHIVPTATNGPALGGHVRLSADITTPQTTSAVFSEESPYIGPTLDRLDETAFVLNDVLGASATPVTTSPGTGTIPVPTANPSPTTAAARCTLKATGNKVLLAAPKGKPKKGAPKIKPGTLTLTVKCGEAGKVTLTGTLTQLIGKKPKHGKQKSKTYMLGPVTGAVKAGRALTLGVKLPVAAVTALGNGGKESATFTVVETGAGGGGRATARIAALAAIR